MMSGKFILKFIVTGLLLISFGRALSQDTLKCWSISDKLKWSDFKGRVPFEEQQTLTKAVCPYDIWVDPFRENGVLHYKAKLVFFKNKAWTKDTSKIVLEHEQLHFDIAEIYTRKLRKAIHEVLWKNKKPTSKDYTPVIKGILEEDNKRQSDYDNETVHGVIRENQRKWEKQIRLELEQLKEYTTALEDCDYKPPLQRKDSLKCWNGDKLKWGDFKGAVPSTGLSSSDKAECLCTPMTYRLKENDSTYIYKAVAIFNRYNSWAKAKDTTKYLLAHEQLHFDIAELYARKMRKAFKGLGNWTESTANAYNAIRKRIHADHIARQNDYDAKTAHGIVKKVQQEWANKVHAELEVLKEFAPSAADCASKK